MEHRAAGYTATRLFEYSRSSTRFVIEENDDGIDPARQFTYKYKTVSFVRLPIDDGIEPVRLCGPTFTDTTSPLEHTTPVQPGELHTDVVGTPPALLHLHPVTAVFEPRLVDDTRSHMAAS